MSFFSPKFRPCLMGGSYDSDKSIKEGLGDDSLTTAAFDKIIFPPYAIPVYEIKL